MVLHQIALEMEDVISVESIFGYVIGAELGVTRTMENPDMEFCESSRIGLTPFLIMSSR